MQKQSICSSFNLMRKLDVASLKFKGIGLIVGSFFWPWLWLISCWIGWEARMREFVSLIFIEIDKDDRCGIQHKSNLNLNLWTFRNVTNRLDTKKYQGKFPWRLWAISQEFLLDYTSFQRRNSKLVKIFSRSFRLFH